MDRYSRQRLFAPFGDEGQERLLASRAGIVGCGALGAAAAETLARAGVGRLRIVDRDFVEESNLQRQTLFNESHARQRLPKAEAARQALAAINSEVEVESWVRDLDWRNVESFAEGCDLLLDGSDNFETRFLVNDCAVSLGIPWIYAAALGSYGVSAPLEPSAGTPCLRCLMEEPPAPGTVETCETAGILGPTVQAVSSFQTAQALRRLSGHAFVPAMLRVEVWEGRWRTGPLRELRNPDCPCCAKGEFPYLEGEKADRGARLCGRDSVQIRPAKPVEIDFDALEARLQGSVELGRNPYLLRIAAEGRQIHLFRDGRAIISGTSDPGEARSLYARYIGE